MNQIQAEDLILVFAIALAEAFVIFRLYSKRKKEEDELKLKEQVLNFVSYIIAGEEAGMPLRRLVLEYSGEPKEFLGRVKKIAESNLSIEEAVFEAAKAEKSYTLRKFAAYFFLKRRALEMFYNELKREIEKAKEKEINKKAKASIASLSLTGVLPVLLVFLIGEIQLLIGVQIPLIVQILFFGLLFPFAKIALYLVV